MAEWIEVSGLAQDIRTIELAFGELSKGLSGYPSFNTHGKQPTILEVRHIQGFGPQLLRALQERINKLPLRGQVIMTLKNS